MIKFESYVHECSKWVSGAELSSAIYSLIYNSSESLKRYRLSREWQGCRAWPLWFCLSALVSFSPSLSLRMNNFLLKTITTRSEHRIESMLEKVHSCTDKAGQGSNYWQPAQLYRAMWIQNSKEWIQQEDCVQGTDMWVKVDHNIITDWPNMWQYCNGCENSIHTRACPHYCGRSPTHTYTPAIRGRTSCRPKINTQRMTHSNSLLTCKLKCTWPHVQTANFKTLIQITNAVYKDYYNTQLKVSYYSC